MSTRYDYWAHYSVPDNDVAYIKNHLSKSSWSQGGPVIISLNAL